MDEINHTNWRDYLAAAQRQICIARYHLKMLDQELSSLAWDVGAEVPIPVQAHFEGVILSSWAAVQKTADAIRIADETPRRAPRSPRDHLKETFQTLFAAVSGLELWIDSDLRADLNGVRNPIAHRSSKKEHYGNPVWEIQRPSDSKYSGSRELSKYASAAVDFVAELGSYLGRIESGLASREA